MPRPRLPRFEPYSDFSRPVWLDIMHLMRRPFPVRNTNGYPDLDPPTTPTSASLLTSDTSSGSNVFNITQGHGARFFPMMPVLVGDNASNWQITTIQSISVDAITCYVAARQVWPLGSWFVPLWGNEAHLSSWGQTWLGALLANAVLGDYDVSGRNILGSVGAITTFGAGDLPTGWSAVGVCTFLQASWATSSAVPICRMGSGRGVQVTTAAADTGGTGIQLATPVTVQPGQEYSLSALCKSVNSAGFTLQAYDASNSAVIAETGTATATQIGNPNEANVAVRRFTVSFAVPEGCTQLQVRFLSTSHTAASRVGCIDDVILVPARTPVAFSQYVIPDVRPYPIVLFGDSWGAGTLADRFTSIVQARYPGISVVNVSKPGYNLNDLNGLFDSLVRPLQPGVIVHYSGLQNDISDSAATATKEGWIDTYIQNARSIGARPVFFGASPHVTKYSEACDLNDALRARCALHAR